MFSVSRPYLNKFDPIKGIETILVGIAGFKKFLDLNKFDPIKGIETLVGLPLY